MLNLTDVKKTRLYQEDDEEGLDKGRDETLLVVAKRMIANGRPIKEITQITGLKPERIRKLKP